MIHWSRVLGPGESPIRISRSNSSGPNDQRWFSFSIRADAFWQTFFFHSAVEWVNWIKTGALEMVNWKTQKFRCFQQ